MEQSVYLNRLKKIRADIVSELQSAHPAGKTPTSLLSCIPRAQNIHEILGVLQTMVKRGEVLRSSDASPIYKLADDFGKSDGASPKTEQSSGPAPKPAPVEQRPSSDKSQGPVAERIFEVIKSRENVPGPELLGLFGSSTYPALKLLRDAGRIYCSEQHGATKCWSVCDAYTDTVTAPAPHATSTEPVLVDRTDRWAKLLTGRTSNTAELVPEAEFDAMASKHRVGQILDAVESKSEAGQVVPQQWLDELRRRLQTAFGDESKPRHQLRGKSTP